MHPAPHTPKERSREGRDVSQLTDHGQNKGTHAEHYFDRYAFFTIFFFIKSEKQSIISAIDLVNWLEHWLAQGLFK